MEIFPPSVSSFAPLKATPFESARGAADRNVAVDRAQCDLGSHHLHAIGALELPTMVMPPVPVASTYD